MTGTERSEDDKDAEADAVKAEQQADKKHREEAIEDLISNEMPNAAAGTIIDVDPRLSQETETEKIIEKDD